MCGEGHSFLASVDLHLHSREARAALAWAESVALVSQTGVSDDEFEELLRQFSEKEIVDLTLITASMNAWNRMAISFRQGPIRRAEG